MADPADLAHVQEEAFRAASLAQARHTRGRGPDMSDGSPRCWDCGEEIPAARLAKVPDAECCVGCQGERESNRRF